MTRFVDSNALLRLILQDLPEQFQQVKSIVDAVASNDLIVLDAVIEEVCFILEFGQPYRMPRPIVYENLKNLLSHPAFNVTPLSLRAIELYGENLKLDYVDCLLAVQAGFKKARLITFDKDLLRVLN